jgi:hypothetical protein
MVNVIAFIVATAAGHIVMRVKTRITIWRVKNEVYSTYGSQPPI